MNKKAVSEFQKLLDVSDHLMGPQGCPWDREQTLASLRTAVLEEACEVIEAIDAEDYKNLVEELGDLLYNVIFFSKLGEKDKRFTTEEVIATLREKLISRHPHVFKSKTVKTAKDALKQWEKQKKKEKSDRKSALDGIPKALPSLAKGYKMAGKFEKASYKRTAKRKSPLFSNETELGELLWLISKKARKLGINPEIAFRKTLLDHERDFRHWEKQD